MRNSTVATSVRLPEGMEMVLDEVVKKLHTTRTSFIRKAILERIEDEIDIAEIEKILAKKNKSFSLREVKDALEMAN